MSSCGKEAAVKQNVEVGEQRGAAPELELQRTLTPDQAQINSLEPNIQAKAAVDSAVIKEDAVKPELKPQVTLTPDQTQMTLTESAHEPTVQAEAAVAPGVEPESQVGDFFSLLFDHGVPGTGAPEPAELDAFICTNLQNILSMPHNRFLAERLRSYLEAKMAHGIPGHQDTVDVSNDQV